MSVQFWTVPQIARLLGTNADKPLGWIHSGQLEAVNIAQGTTGRARWRISDDAFQAFLARRSSKPPAPKPTRARKQKNVVEYY